METKENNQPAETQEQLVFKKAQLLARMIENSIGLKKYVKELWELHWQLKDILHLAEPQI